MILYSNRKFSSVLTVFFPEGKSIYQVSKLPYQTLSLGRISTSPKNQVQINRGIVCCNGQDFHLKWKRILSFFILLNKILHRYEHAHYCYILCCSKVQVSRHLLQKSGVLRTLGLRTDSNAQSICLVQNVVTIFNIPYVCHYNPLLILNRFPL